LSYYYESRMDVKNDKMCFITFGISLWRQLSKLIKITMKFIVF